MLVPHLLKSFLKNVDKSRMHAQTVRKPARNVTMHVLAFVVYTMVVLKGALTPSERNARRAISEVHTKSARNIKVHILPSHD